MAWLNEIFAGNTLQQWLIAAAVVLAALTVLLILQRVALAKLSKMASKTDHLLDDLIVEMLRKTKIFILIIAASFFASRFVELKPAIDAIWQKAVILAVILQIGIWASAGITFWMRRTTDKQLKEDAASATTMTFLGFIARLVLWAIVLLLVLDNVGINITGLVAGLGIGGIAMALAVQNILGDLLASLSIVLDKPFVIGDFVVVDTHAGTIEHIGLKTTRVRSISGEQLIFSNKDLLTSRIRNYKRMQERRAVFTFGVIYQTPVEKLKSIKSIVADIIDQEEYARFDRAHFKEYGDSSLNFEVVYFVTVPEMKTYLDIQEDINLRIFERFQKEGIEFAYPTRTLFVQREKP